MKKTNLTQAGQQYAAAYKIHYGEKNLREALGLYLKIIARHPDTHEAGYSRSQTQNIIRAVVPSQELFDAQVNCALSSFE